jgi:hypothetical protein
MNPLRTLIENTRHEVPPGITRSKRRRAAGTYRCAPHRTMRCPPSSGWGDDVPQPGPDDPPMTSATEATERPQSALM